tara:strand:+ start:3031 stop:4824 length:1794 start_codon:yes stop_codon:yes gene_type:complete
MDRKKLNKFEHIRKANILFENRYENQNKTIRTEQQLGDGTGDGYVDQQDVDYVTNNWLQPGDVYDSNDGIINLSDLSLTTANFGQGSPPESLPTGPCWLTYADSTVGGTAYASGLDFSPGGTHFQMYCAWWFTVGTGTGYGTYPLVPNIQQWYWNPNNTNPPGPLSSILQEPTGTGASNFIDCGCDLSGNTAPTWYTGTTTGSTTGSTTGTTTGTTGPVTCYGCDANNQFGGQPNITSVGNGIIGYGGGSTGVGFFCDPNTPCANTGVCGNWNGITMYSAQNNPALAQCGGATTGTTGSLKCYGCMSGVIVDSWMYPNASQFVTSDSSGICSVYQNTPGQNPWVGEPNVWYTDVNSVTPGGASGDPCGGATTATTGGTGTIACYGCQNGQIVTNSNTFFNSNMYGGTVCGTSSQGGVSTTWYGNQNDPALANCTGSPTGTTCDISYNTPCAQQHLTTGAQSSWDPWLALRQTGWDSVDCQHLQNVVNWTTDQLNSGVTGNGTALNPTQIARKTEKREWAQCQAAECGCATLNMPPLTGGPTPPPPSAPPTGGPKNTAQEKPRVDGWKDKEKEVGREKDKKKLKEEFTRMKTMWKYRI